MQASNKVILNTGILYAQLVIGMIMGFFTTRLVLNALGETNYGIYMLVAVVVGMLGILNSNMANTSMRYMAHSLGKNDIETTLKTFNTTLFLHFVIGITIILFMELGGWLMFNYALNIPDNKLYDAKVVFQFMVISTFVTIISVPYDAVMNSHENILALSIFDILGYLLKLGVAIYITCINNNLLILYGFLMLVVQVILRIIKQWYCKKKYEECKIMFRRYVDKVVMKSILSFTGWNLFGSISAMSVIQMKGILLNMFFGVSVNAADGISNTASSQVNLVSVNMTRAIKPQVIKSEGGGNRLRMLRITEISTKFSIFLFSLFAVPVFLEANFLFKIWLKEVPNYAVIFFQLSLLAMLIEKLSFQIINSIMAIGNIKVLTVAESIISVAVVPIAYFSFQYGYSPVAIFIILIILSFIKFFERLFLGRKIAGINNIMFIRNAILPILISVFISLTCVLIIRMFMSEGFIRTITVFASFCSTLALSFWMLGLNLNEKHTLKKLFKKFNMFFHKF